MFIFVLQSLCTCCFALARAHAKTVFVLKSDEEDGDNEAKDDTDDKQEARWNDQLDNIQVPDFLEATGFYLF